MKFLQWTFYITLFFSFLSNTYSQICNSEDSVAMYRLRSGLNITAWGGSIDSWLGVNTIPDPASPSTHYRISSIDLSTQPLASGSIPDSIFHGDRLTMLETLNLSGNPVTGIDGFLKPNNLGPLHSLKYLNISYCSFTSGNNNFFLYFLSNMDSLLDLTAASVFSTSSSLSNYTFPNCNSLESIDIRYNYLQNTLDLANILAAYPNLHFLYVESNELTAVIPPTASSNLEKLAISDNLLQSFQPLATLAENTPTLRWLMANNVMDTLNIQDTLVFNLSSPLINLLELDISNNKLRGTFPSDILEKLPSLYALYVNNNLLHGSLPDAKTVLVGGPFNGVKVYGSLTDIGQFDISNNMLSGDLRMDWLFGSQLHASISSLGANMNLERFYAQNNHFDRIMPQLSNTSVYAALSTALSQRFSNLEEVFIENNNLDFKDLFKLQKVFRFYQQNITGQAHYVPQAAPSISSFTYAPQGDLGIGGVRRRNPGARVTMDSDNGIEEAEVGFTNYIGNKYLWERIDTAGLIGGTAANPITQFLGQVQQQGGGVTPNLITDNTGGLAQTDPSYLIGVDTTSNNINKIGIDNLDSLKHHAWLYRAVITNDSFPFLTLNTIPKKIEVGGCVDSSGAPVHCQTMIVQFHPDTLALLSLGQQDSLKNAIRTELGAVPLDVCLCGDIELWGISDTASTMLEGNSQGTKNASSSASTKPQLLSADPNYSLLGGTSNGLPDTVAITAGSGNTTAKTLVAIIDSGVDYEYAALKPYISEGASTASACLPNAIWGYNFYSDSNNPTDDHGHGTAVAGIVAGISQQSILPDTGSLKTDIGILPLKYTDKNGAGSLFHAACALRYAADYQRPTSNGGTAKVRVINTSWGYYGDPCMVLENVIKYVGEDCGILIVASAGNNGVRVEGVKENRHWPSNSIFDPQDTIAVDNILAVGGVDAGLNNLDPMSNYGTIHIDLTAPWNEVSIKAGTINGFGAVGGTSFSAPQVSRAAALLFDKYPDATYFAVKYALTAGVDVLQSSDSLKIVSKGRVNYHKADSIMNIISDRSTCSKYFNTIAVDKIENIEQFVQVYPNPFATELWVEIDHVITNSETINVQLFNIQGQLLQQQQLPSNTNSTSLSTKDLPAGIYVLKLSIGGNQYSKKVIKFNP